MTFQPLASDYDSDDQFVCTACGHSCNCIDETERPRDECPVCGEESLVAKAKGTP